MRAKIADKGIGTSTVSSLCQSATCKSELERLPTFNAKCMSRLQLTVKETFGMSELQNNTVIVLLTYFTRGSTRSFFSLSHESQKKHNSELPRHPLFFPLFFHPNTPLFKVPIPPQCSMDPPRPLARDTPFPCMGIGIISSLAYAASPGGYAKVGRFVSFAPLAAQHCAKKNGTMIFFPFPPINCPPTHSVL